MYIILANLAKVAVASSGHSLLKVAALPTSLLGVKSSATTRSLLKK